MAPSSLAAFFAFGPGSANTSDNDADDDDGASVSSGSTASPDAERHPASVEHPDAEQVTLPALSTKGEELKDSAAKYDNGKDEGATETKTKHPLRLLDLPVDVLKDIVKEVTHTNDLTSLALTCSALHSLAIPHMYSRFDIVWPDTLSAAEHPAGVDALSYGLATLVMGEDVFREIPWRHSQPSAPSPCPHCGCDSYHHSTTTNNVKTTDDKKPRRGNYFAQYTRKFSVGNGPLLWVQEYSITKETGKMLGTLVALAVARMVNLESFIWDMPTGVLRDVWIALASLADRPGHDCRLERVWVRWHDNSENASIDAVPAMTVPPVPNIGASIGGVSFNPSTHQTSLQRYNHVEYPTLSILPPLKSLSVLDIDEPSYLDEMALLIESSRDRLRELRIGIALKAHLSLWLRPLEDRRSEQDPLVSDIPNWPRVGGVLDILLGKFDDEKLASTNDTRRTQPDPSARSATPQISVNVVSQIPEGQVLDQGHMSTGQTEDISGADSQPAVPVTESADIPSDNRDLGSVTASDSEGTPTAIASSQTESAEAGMKSQPESSSRDQNRTPASLSNSTADSRRRKLKLEVLELERVFLSIPAIMRGLDWCQLTSLTILRCEDHEKLWRALRSQYAPSNSSRSPAKTAGLRKGHGEGKDTTSSAEYPLKLRCLHTDAVSPYLILFLKETIAPNSLESLFLQEGPMYESIVPIEGIHRNVIRRQRASLKKILIDSTERTPAGHEISNSHWRKWIFNREMISFITSGRMPQLRELGMAINYKDWHYFLQRLPYLSELRSLYLPNVDHRLHVDPKELALQILDIVTLRPEIQLCYLGLQTKCYEILENTSRGRRDAFDDAENSQDELLPESDEPGDGGEANDDDQDADGASAPDSHDDYDSEVFNAAGDDDSDDSLDCSRPRVSFKLREILFYDDKVSIFRARHGEL